VVAKFGLLEWFFVGLLVALTAAVTIMAVYIVAQLFRNPSRRAG
jgi:hypothetical protein